MRIYNISNNINFGYNRDLNEKVKTKLQNDKANKKINEKLLQLNDICNDVEEELKTASANSDWTTVNHYEDMFNVLKPYLANQFDIMYPKLNYRRTEIDTYKEELTELSKNHDNPEYEWLEETIENLQIDEEFMGNDFEAPNLEQLFMGDLMTGVGEGEKSEAQEVSDYVEKFEPNEYTPKGFDSLGGMKDLKETLTDKIIIPMKNPELAKLDEIEYGKKNPRGFLFYGPPGCGKTSIAQALSMEAEVPMFKPKVIDNEGASYVNGAATNMKMAYEFIKKYAKEHETPVIMFIDEIESLAGDRQGGSTGSKEDDKLVSTLLPILEDARGNNIIVIGATNKYELLDDAVKSRMEDKIYIGLPNKETRESVLAVHLSKRSKGRSLAENSEELAKVAEMTKGFSNRDIAILVDKAAGIARKDGRRDIKAEDFIIPVKNNQNMKVKEHLYKDEDAMPKAGFNIGK